MKQYIDDFHGYGMKFSADDDALSAIAKSAADEKTGARGLLTVLEKLLRDFKFELPSTNVKSIKITKDVVSDPAKSLSEIIKKASADSVKRTHEKKSQGAQNDENGSRALEVI